MIFDCNTLTHCRAICYQSLSHARISYCYQFKKKTTRPFVCSHFLLCKFWISCLDDKNSQNTCKQTNHLGFSLRTSRWFFYKSNDYNAFVIKVGMAMDWIEFGFIPARMRFASARRPDGFLLNQMITMLLNCHKNGHIYFMKKDILGIYFLEIILTPPQARVCTQQRKRKKTKSKKCCII